MKRWHFFEEFEMYRYGRAKNTVIAVDTTSKAYHNYLNTDFALSTKEPPRRVELNAIWCFPNEWKPMAGKISGHQLRTRFVRTRRKKAFKMYQRLSRFLRSIQ